MSLLEVQGLSIRFGGVVAIDDLSVSVEAGQICSIIGPNGAGKTSLLNCLSRLYEPSDGRITFDGTDLLARPAHALAAVGIARTFQNLALFSDMTVLENVMTGRHARATGGYLAATLRLPRLRRSEREVTERSMELLAQLGIADLADHRAADLPYGTQKRVEIARALAAEPRLLLLDEPAAGLVQREVEALADEIRVLRDLLDLTVVLVEHHMRMVMQISDEVVVLNFGRCIASGPPAEVANDDEVIAAYLGAVA